MKLFCYYIFAIIMAGIVFSSTGCRDRQKYEISIFAEEGVRNPKHITIGHKDNIIYYDGNRIRSVSRKGKASIDLLHARDVQGRAFGLSIRNVGGLEFDAEEKKLYLSAGHAIIKMDLDAEEDYETEIFAGDRNLSGYEDGLGQEARFNDPRGLALDKNGNIFVADSGNRLVRKITPAGKVSTVAGKVTDKKERERRLEELVDGAPNQATFCQIVDLCVGPDGNIFVAHLFGGVIRKIDLEGNVTTIIDLTDDIYAGVQQGICVDPDGNLFVTNSMRGTLAKITPEGKKTVVGGPSRIWHPHRGRIRYHGSQTTNAIGKNGKSAMPRGLTIDERGVIYIAERTHLAILMARPRQ